MKAKIIIASWFASLMLMATNSLTQAITALCCFGVSSLLLNKYKREVTGELQKFNTAIDKLIKKQSI